MKKPPRIALSFDFEECDLPRESGVDFPLADGMRVSIEGADAVLDILERRGVKATFFCTLNFAERADAVMRRIIAGGHELAAHGVDHFHQTAEDPFRCREGIKRLYGVECAGYRQPRMFPVDDAALKSAGYRYNSSLNPAFIPGRYCHFDVPRRPFVKDGLLQFPASVTPLIRFPLFWLALHLLPQWLYRLLARRTLAHDGYLMTYFHPWEFSTELAARRRELKVPALVKPRLGEGMRARLEAFIAAMQRRGAEFVTVAELAEELRPRAEKDAPR